MMVVVNFLLLNIQKQPVGGIVDKIVSGFQVVHGGQVDEEAIMNKCRNSISFFENVEKEIGGNTNSGTSHNVHC